MYRNIKISLVTLLALLSIFKANGAGGNAGKNIKWELSDSILTFYGNGQMVNFGSEQPYREDMVAKIIITEGITSIGENMAKGCKNLVTVILPTTLSSIGKSAFAKCKRLTNIQIPSSVSYIGEEAFADCSSLRNLDLKNVEKIGKKAFQNCTSLHSLILPSSIDNLGYDAFKGCKKLKRIGNIDESVDISRLTIYGLSESIFRQEEELSTSNLTKSEESDFSYTESIQTTEIEKPIKEEVEERKASKPEQTVADNGVEQPKVTDVDNNIPVTNITNINTFVVIIANENYNKFSNVPYARNDGEIFSRYCSSTLGVPQENILLYNDATYGNIREALSDLRLINSAIKGDMKIIFYYAGHGAPDEKTLEPYLIPVDASRINKEVCIPMANIYEELASMDISSATVFLDACFSGGTRDGRMITEYRGIALRPKVQTINGKVAVISATSNAQTALPFEEKGHGMFTYYLLKCLQDSKGDADLNEIYEYVRNNVHRSSTILKRKEQIPSVSYSNMVSDSWSNWKLNN